MPPFSSPVNLPDLLNLVQDAQLEFRAGMFGVDKDIQHSKGFDVNDFADLSSCDDVIVPPSHHDMS